MIKERFELITERLNSIIIEDMVQSPYLEYFHKTAKFLCLMKETQEELQKRDWNTVTEKELQKQNRLLYEDILPNNYENSYANPKFAQEKLGKEYAAQLSFLYTEMRSIIPFVYENNIAAITIRMELFVEIYGLFYAAYEEMQEAPKTKEVEEALYWFVSDYSETEMERRVQEQLDPKDQFLVTLIEKSDLSDLRYLYYTGEYITENEIKTAKFLNTLEKETIYKMADTFSEGYRIGFVNGNKDLTKKKTVNIRYSAGFERVVKRAIENFKDMGLDTTIYRAGTSIFHKRSNMKIGYYGAIANKQFDYDHKEDEALFLDKKLMNRKLEILREAYETNKEWASLHAGPACIEVFGEEPFVPIHQKEAPRLSEEQQKIAVEYTSKQGQIMNEYLKGEERSYTIIAFPTPEIGENFEEIFEEIVKINTLDYKLYETIQQKIIDILDKARYVRILGKGDNETDMTVALQTLQNPEKETIFENCVADVNIPVGEVFTSPELLGTNGILHVSRVYLGELEYQNLKVYFENGKIKDYTCSNFETEEENKSYIKENILFHHDTLPLGEFAIGTNTTAYVVAKKYKLETKLPILIAEKMGPHFAVGDTCYSHSEDVTVKNPNGKEIIAKDNEVSVLRKKDLQKAYFNCHTDITIPYDEIKSLFTVNQEGEEVEIIQDGRFVLDGTEKLNEPFFNY